MTWFAEAGAFANCGDFGEDGQLGNGTTTGLEICGDDGYGLLVCSTVRVAVVGGHSFAQVDVGVDHTCARTGANCRRVVADP